MKKLLLALALLLSGKAEAGSLLFNGTTDFARSTAPPITTYPFTMCAWFYPTAFPVNVRVIGFYDPASTALWGMTVLTSGVLRAITINAAGTNISVDTTNTAALNTWSFGCNVHASATSHRVILNGNIAGAASSATSDTPTNIGRFSVGAGDGTSLGNFFSGSIGETEVWNVAITDGEIAALASPGVSPLKTRPQNQVLFTPYPEIAFQDWYGHAFTLTGTTPSVNAPPTGHP